MNTILMHSILTNSTDEICSYLKVEKSALSNCVFRPQLSGCNYQVCPIDFFNNTKEKIGSIFIKYNTQENERAHDELLTEARILKLLGTHGINCPTLIGSGHIDVAASYLLLEEIEAYSIDVEQLSLDETIQIADSIDQHQTVLVKNLEKLRLRSIELNMYKHMDFEQKIHALLTEYVPSATLIQSLQFLNTYLNAELVIKNRSIVTDRSTGNILKNEDRGLVFIDFSTIRVGTRYDNWIQFIDDPRVNLCCPKEWIEATYFKKHELSREDIESYYAASIYTNLLQGIYTYQKSVSLGAAYLKNANESFVKLRNKKDVLIRLGN